MPRGGSSRANSDFYLSFGSNADTWASELAGKLAPAEATLRNIGDLLNRIDQGANSKRIQELGRALGGAGGAGGRAAATELDTSKIMGQIDGIVSELKEASRLVGLTVSRLGKLPDAAREEVIFQNRSGGQKQRIAEGRGSLPNQQPGFVGGPGMARRPSLIQPTVQPARPAKVDPQAQQHLAKARQQQAEMRQEVEAAKRAVTQATAEIAKMHAAAAATGKSFDTGAYEAQIEKLERATANLPKFTAELEAATTVLARLEREAAKATEPTRTTQPAVRVADVTQAQIDEGSINRLVQAIHEVRDAVNRQGIKGGKPAAGVTAHAATTTTATPAAPAAEAETAVETLRRQVAVAESTHQQLKALSDAAGTSVTDAQRQQLETLQSVLSQGKAALAKAEREEQGITRGEQRTARREASAFARGPDLPEEEYERRRRVMQGINVAAGGGMVAGKGKGQYSKERMFEIARELNKLGFAVDFNTKTKAADLAHGIASASSALKTQFGAETPDELKTGRKLIADKVSDAVRGIIEAANISAVQAAEEAEARDAVRLAHLSGNLPDDPVTRLTKSVSGGATSLAGQRLSGPIAVPPSVHGGRYTDAYGYMDSINMLRGRSLARAGSLAQNHPDFDPFKVNLRESVTGQGPEATAHRTAFRELRHAYRELDEMGEQFKIFSEALAQNEEFVDRASSRLNRAAGAGIPTGEAYTRAEAAKRAQLEADARAHIADNKARGTIYGTPDDERRALENSMRLRESSGQYDVATPKQLESARIRPEDAGKLATDAQKIEAALERISVLSNALNSDRFKAHQDVFEDPDYQRGLEQRSVSRREQDAWMAKMDEQRRNRVDVRDAMGGAIADARLVPGTKDTYVKGVPGLGFNRQSMSYEYSDPNDARHKTKPLDELNRAASFFHLQQRSHDIRDEVAAGERPMEDLDKVLRKAENKATAFANQLEEIFGVVMPVSKLLQGQGEYAGYSGQTSTEAYQFLDPQNEEAERRRMDRYRQQVAETNKKPPKKSELTDDQKAHEADQQLRVAKLRQKKAIQRQEEATEALTRAQKDLESGVKKLTKAEQAEFEAARGQLGGLARQRNALENIFLREDPAARDTKTPETVTTGQDQARARIERAREEEAKLRRQEAAQRAAVTRARKALAEEGAGASKADLRAPMSKGATGLLQPEGRLDYVPKPILERKPGAWLGDLQGMESKKVNSLLQDIGSPLRHGSNTIEEIASEFENWQKGARRIGEVVPDAEGVHRPSGATMYDVNDPRYGRGASRAGQSPLASHLNRLSSAEMGYQYGEKRIHAPVGMRAFLSHEGSGMIQPGAEGDAARLTDFFTKHLGKGMPKELTGELRKFVQAAGSFIAGEGSVHALGKGANDPKFDILRDLASKAPTVDTPLYRGMKRAPRFDEQGNLLGSTRDLASWSSQQKTAELFGSEHHLRMVGGQALSLGSMGGMDEFLAHGEYKLKRQYDDPSSPGRTIYEVEQVKKKTAAENASTKAAERVTKATAKLTDVETKLAAARAKVADLERESFPFVTGKGAVQAGIEGDAAATALAQKFPDRGHHPGEKLDTLGYPSRYGYAPDLGETKTRLDQELGRVRDTLRKALPKEAAEKVGRQIKELAQLKEGRAGRAAEIGTAAAEGDLKENAGYHAAKERQGQAEARIAELEAQIDKAFGVESIDKLVVEAERADREVADLTATIEKLGGTAAGAVKGPARQASENVVSQTPEAIALRAQVAAGNKTRADYSKLRQDRRQATSGGDEWKRLTADMEAMRKQGIPTKPEMTKLRRDLAALDKAAAAAAREAAAAAGAGGAGGGGGKPTARGAASGRPGDGGTNNILRDILTAVNGIHKTIQTRGGTKTVRVDEAGNPVARKSRASNYATDAELKQAKSTDPRQVALAAAAQQQRLERLRPSDVSRSQGQAIRENEKLVNLTQAQAHQKLQLQRATQLLDAAAKQELATLRNLVKSGADNERIAKQQAVAVGALNRSLSQSGVTHASDRAMLGRTLMSDAGGSKVSADTYQQMSRSSKAVDGFKAVDESMAQGVPGGGMFGEHSAFTKAMFGNSSFWSRVMASTGTFVVRNFAAGFVFGITNALQEVIKQAILTESTFIRVSDALEQTGRSVGDLRTNLQGISTQYGVALNDVYETAAGLTGLFDSTDDIAGATKIVAQLQMISMGALNAQEAMGVLASITGAYATELEGGVGGLEHVADVLTVVQNVLGTNVEVTAEGVGRLSGLSKQLKIDFEDTAVYVAQIAKLTNQTGAAAGEQFSRILGSMQTGRGRAALQESLPGSGIAELVAGGEYGAAIQELMKHWSGLTETQQRNLTVSLAGQRQAAAFAALMNNSSKVLNASARAHDANGEAEQRSEKIANTLNNQIARLMSNFQNLAHELVRSGILDFFGIALKAANATFGVINHFLSTLNDIADNNPFLNFLKHIGVGLLGLILTLKLASAAFGGFKASMAAAGASQGIMGAGIRGAQGSGAFRPSLAGGLTTFSQARTDRATELAKRGLAPTATPGQSAPRTFAVSPGGVAVQQDLTKGTQAQIKANQMAARAASGAAKGTTALAGAGLGLTAVMIGATVAIALVTKEFSRVKEMAEKLEGLRDSYDAAGRPLSEAEQQERYVGPATEIKKQNTKDTKGWFSAAIWDVTHLDEPSWGTSNDKDVQAWRGQLDDGMQGKLDNLNKVMDTALDGLDYGDTEVDTSSLTSYLQTGADSALAGAMQSIMPTATIQEAEAAGARVGQSIASTRKDIFEQYDAGEINEAQMASMLAGVEEVAIETNDRVAAIILRARGIAEADALSMEQMKSIDQLRGSLVSLQGGGVLGATTTSQVQVGLDPNTTIGVTHGSHDEFFDKVIEETGTREGSVVEKQLRKLYGGGLTRVQAMKADRKIIEVEAENAKAKYLAALAPDSGMEEEDIEGYKTEALTKLQELNQKTQDILQAAADAGVAIADAAGKAGHYERGVAAIEHALKQMGAERAPVREFETPEIRAQRNTLESSTAEAGATARAQGLNKRLELAKGRNQGAQREAGLEAQIAQNEFFALKSMQAVAQIAGTQGPPMAAIRAAKVRWIEAQISMAQQAQAANIAAMTAAAASLWNGIASAGAQEDIALQQYKDAVKNTGSKNSTEALNALAAYKSAQHNTTTTLDAVAQAQRDAALAAIPQGDAVAVAHQGVANAQAALAAAEKYDHNSVEYQGALSQLYSAQQQAMAAENAVAAAMAQIAVARADARGDAVASAHANVRVAQVTLANAREASGGALSADVLAAQASLISANAAVSQAQTDLVTSRVAVSIALADAAGHTVRSAALALKSARIRLHAALRRSGGEATAEVNQARAEAISAEAASRDAVLQDQLDTIDFNVEMGRMTKSAAISALQQILKTSDLTKQQRRDLMLQIKNMKDEISGDGMWNFGDIKLPKPYQMRRYIEAQRIANNRAVQNALSESGGGMRALDGAGGHTYNDNRNVQIDIHGGDEARVRRIVREVVGKPGRTRTTQPRRGRR